MSKWYPTSKYVNFEDSEEVLFMDSIDIKEYKKETNMLMKTVKEDKHDKEAFWFVDLACSHHMTWVKEWFIHIDETYQHKVKLGNDHKLEAKGSGDIHITVNGMAQVITNVNYVPLLTSNLMCVGQIQEKSLNFVIQGSVCIVFHPQMVWSYYPTWQRTRCSMCMLHSSLNN